ncbi:MAG: formylglycine-generating enzyme family protein, partial [Candidatus Electrothrix sp. AR3]|nr:formylglycine-generating enzyme family protein [Candidatus Electrothrix sp. AR3]
VWCGLDEQLQLMSNGEGTFIMTASSAIQTALEKEGDANGLFTKHLVAGIRSGEADKNEDGLVDMHELYEYVHAKVQEEGAQEPMKWDLHAKGKIIISRSGKESREEQIRKAKKKLFELGAQELLSENIVFAAVNVLSIPKQKMTAKDQKCSLLVEQLVHAKINPPVFIEQWMRTCFAHTHKITEPEKTKVSHQAKQVHNDPPRATRAPVASAPQQGDIIKDKATGMELVYIPAGCFMMGSSPDDEGHQKNEGPVHEVCLNAFWMGKYQVTQGQWQKIMGQNPAKFQKGDKYPVEQVSWDDVQSFLKKLNKKSGKGYRLPTESEWEYACRANGSSKYSGGDDLDALGWYYKNSGHSTHPVGKKKANAFGLHDMSGNVWEWCHDWYGADYYASSPKDNPTGPNSGTDRVLRGGYYFGYSLNCRSVFRDHRPPEERDDAFGFRLVLPFQSAGN